MSVLKSLSESQAELPGWRLYRSLKAYSLIGLNPLASMLCSIITCARCGPEHQTYRWQFEYALSLSVDSQRNSSVLTLDDALASYFAPETINDYTCVKCSIRRYLAKRVYENVNDILDEEVNQAVTFLHRISLS